MGRMRRAVVGDHLVGVAMIGRHERDAALALERGQHLAHARVHGLHGRHRGGDHARVPHHVGVGEVHDVHVGRVSVDGRRQRPRHLRLAHLGLQVVGGHFGAGDERALLARLRLLAPAVEKERHVGVLLGLGDVVLAQARRGQHVGQHVLGKLLGEGHRRGDVRVVLGQAHETHLGPRPAREAVEGGIRHRARELAGAVGTEVEEHHGVAVAHAPAGKRHGLDELVGDAGGVGGLHHLARRRVRARLGPHHGAPGTLDALPTLVAVHRVVAPGDAGDLDGAAVVGKLGHHGLELFEVARPALRRHVAAVHEAVQGDAGHAGGLRGAHEGVEMGVGGVHAPVGHEAHEVQRRSRLGGRRERAAQHGVRSQRAVGAGAVDARELLVDHPSRADVEVPHLGVAHLPRGKAHGLARRLEPRPGTLGEKRVEVRRARLGDGVSGPRLGKAEAVHDHEADGQRKAVLRRPGFFESAHFARLRSLRQGVTGTPRQAGRTTPP